MGGLRAALGAADAVVRGDSVLSERLSDLTAGGLITRTVEGGPPVTVSYQLTERGRALMPALDQIAQWARDNRPPDKC